MKNEPSGERLSEKHNFGKAVYRREVNGEVLIEKQRSIFWERALFSANSKILKILDIQKLFLYQMMYLVVENYFC